MHNGWKPNDELLTAGVHGCKVSSQLHYADERIKMKAIDMLHEKLLFVRRHILHDILPICSTFSPEHEIVDGLNVSNGMLMHTAQSFQQFNLIACYLAIVFN